MLKFGAAKSVSLVLIKLTQIILLKNTFSWFHHINIWVKNTNTKQVPWWTDNTECVLT